MYQDLHTHTIVSDGKMTYQQSLDACADRDISIVAFTDHDLVPEKKELDVLEQLREHPVNWIVGVEISSGPPKELAGKSVSGLHIVGLFVDPKNKDLIEYGHSVVEDCTGRMSKMVKVMADYGFDISMDDVRKQIPGKTVQRPHLVAALLSKDSNIERIKTFIDQIKKESVSDPGKEKIYKEILSYLKSEPGHPYRQPFYTLFLSKDAPFEGVYFEREHSLDFDSSVELIRKAGGIAILAHWSECRFDVPIDLVEKFFKEKRIDGAEIVYDLYRIGLGEEEELRSEHKSIKNLVEKYHLFASGGSDAHCLETFDLFVKHQWFAEQTIGLAEKMIAKKSNLCLDWTTIKK